MTIKPRYILIVFIALLTSCGTTSQEAEATKIQNTAFAIVQTGVALTQTAMPTATPTNTPTALPTSTPPATPTPAPPPLPIFTPDATQVERWQEYQTELAKVLLYGYGPDAYKDALCEWDILGRSDQEVYVWAYCATLGGGDGSFPAVISLEANGAIQGVRVAAYKGSSYDLELFPSDVRGKCGLYTGDSLFFGRLKEMINHLHDRREYPEELPLVVLSATPIATPTP